MESKIVTNSKFFSARNDAYKTEAKGGSKQNFLNNNFGARNLGDNVKDLDFEDPRHPFSQRKILFKKGIELDDEYGYYLIEISQTKYFMFFVAYDV
jgi:hypothetical protein